MSNELAFAENKIAEIQQLTEITKRKKLLEQQEKELKETLCEAMEEYGLVQFKNDDVTISYIAASESVSLDTKAFRAEDPELYDEVFDKYNKRAEKKAYVRVK